MPKAISLSMQVTKDRQDRVERPYSGFHVDQSLWPSLLQHDCSGVWSGG